KQGRPYIAYEFIEGHDLRRQIETELPSIEQAAAWCRDIARAMQHAHEQGVMHRDLKPDNVMLQISSNKIKVIDLGLGRSLTPLGHDDNSLSNEFHFVGTRRWAAPEQFREKATFASDIYLIGSILYYSLTRQAPSDPKIMPSSQPADLNTTTELLEPSTGDPGSINQIRRAIGAPEISSILENICLQALQPKPSDRQTNAKELADQLDQFLGVNQNFNPRQVTKRKLGLVRKSVAITTLCLLPAILFFATLTVARRLDESHDRKQGFSRLSTQEFKVIYGSLGAIKETGFIPWLRTGVTEIKPEGITLIEFKATPFEYREKAIKSFTLSLEIRPHGDDPKFGIFLGSRNLSEKHKQQHVIFLDRLREQGQSPIEEPKLLVAYHRLARLELTLTDEGEELRRIPGQENHQEEFQFPCQTANYWIPLECTVAANHVTSLVIDGRDCLNIINENLLKEWPISPANEQNQIVHGLFVWAAGTDGCEVRNVKRKIVYQE
ncbi:MAG: serine/threonine protein kinase, partial [Planctomycetota bacterium]